MKKIKLLVLSALFGAFATCAVYAVSQENSQPTGQFHYQTQRKCTRCDGKGYMVIKKTHATCSGRGCNGCNGKGHTEQQIRCTPCNGTGLVTVKKN